MRDRGGSSGRNRGELGPQQGGLGAELAAVQLPAQCRIEGQLFLVAEQGLVTQLGPLQQTAQIEERAAQIGTGLLDLGVGPEQFGQMLAWQRTGLQGQHGQQQARLVVGKLEGQPGLTEQELTASQEAQAGRLEQAGGEGGRRARARVP